MGNSKLWVLPKIVIMTNFGHIWNFNFFPHKGLFGIWAWNQEYVPKVIVLNATFSIDSYFYIKSSLGCFKVGVMFL